MAFTSGQKTELKLVLTANVNEVDKDGILTTLGKTMLGDKKTKDIARAKVLAAKLESGMNYAEMAELNTLLTRNGEEVDEGGLLRDAEKVFVGATQIYRVARARILSALMTTVGSASVSPSMSISRSPSASASRSPSRSPSASGSVSPSASASRSPSVSPSASASRSPSNSPSHSSSISPSPSASPSRSPSDSGSASASRSPSNSASASASRSPSASPSASWST